MDNIGQAGNVVLTLLDDGQGEDRQVHTGDATTDRLSLSLTGSASAVAGVAVGEEESNTGGMQDTLLHGKTLLVVASSDAEDVSLELIAETVAGNLLGHALLHEGAELALIFDLDELLRAIGWVGDVQLHLDGVLVKRLRECVGGKTVHDCRGQ